MTFERLYSNGNFIFHFEHVINDNNVDLNFKKFPLTNIQYKYISMAHQRMSEVIFKYRNDTCLIKKKSELSDKSRPKTKHMLLLKNH